VPYGTDSIAPNFQAMNCLATLIWSLRDKFVRVPFGTTVPAGPKASPGITMIFPNPDWLLTGDSYIFILIL